MAAFLVAQIPENKNPPARSAGGLCSKKELYE
jgi:hypothetical protein